MSATRQLLITRHVPADWLEVPPEAGCRLQALPFIRTLSIQTIEVAQQLQHWAAKPALALFTSPRAVASVATMLGASQPPWQVACVGAATAAAVRQQWPMLSIVGTAYDAASLAAVAIPLAATLPAVHFCGRQRLPVLAAAFVAANRSLQSVMVYETVQQPQRLTQQFHAVLFCSPSAVQSFFSANTVPATTSLLAMGHTTAAAIQQTAGRPADLVKANSIQQFIQFAVARVGAPLVIGAL